MMEQPESIWKQVHVLIAPLFNFKNILFLILFTSLKGTHALMGRAKFWRKEGYSKCFNFFSMSTGGKGRVALLAVKIHQSPEMGTVIWRCLRDTDVCKSVLQMFLKRFSQSLALQQGWEKSFQGLLADQDHFSVQPILIHILWQGTWHWLV